MEVCQTWPNLAKFAYLGAPNMVERGVPEKILQNAVQISPLLLQCKTSDGWP